MNILIRPATVLDIEAISKLHHELAEMHKAIDPIHGIGEWNEDDYKSQLSKQLGDIKFHITVAEVEGKVVGFLLMVIENDSLVHIWEIYVTPGYRENGIAKKLFDVGKQWAKDKCALSIYLYVDTRNEVGINTWESLGFKEYMKKMKFDI